MLMLNKIYNRQNEEIPKLACNVLSVTENKKVFSDRYQDHFRTAWSLLKLNLTFLPPILFPVFLILFLSNDCQRQLRKSS